MGSSYRRLEVQLPQFFREAQREAATCASEVLRMEEQVEEKRIVYEQKEADAASALREILDAGPSEDAVTVPGLDLFLEQYWSDNIPRDADRVQAVRRPRGQCTSVARFVRTFVL
jgi:hypothetical protein